MDPDVKRKSKSTDKDKGLLSKFKNINSENLLKNIWQVSYNSILVAVINLVFHFIMSRKLGPEQYGELETLLTINSMLLISLSGVCFLIAKFVSYYRTRQQFDKMKYLANWAFIFFFFIGMAGLIFTIMMSKIVSSFLNINDSIILSIFGLLVWISFLMPIIEGILRGLQDFKFIGKYKIIDASLKLLIGGTLLFFGLQVKSIIVGFVVASTITLLFASYMLKKMYINRPQKINIKEIYIFAIPVFLTTIFFALLSNIDLVLVKHYFNATITGYYAAAAMLAKIVVQIAFGSAGVMFPKIVEEYSNGNTKIIYKTFRNTLKISILAGFIITLILAVYPHQISKLFFGSQYDIGYMLTIFAFATFFSSISSIIMMYDLAVKKYGFIAIFFAAAFIEIYQITQLHRTLFDVVWTLFIINLAVLSFMTYYNRKALFEKYY